MLEGINEQFALGDQIRFAQHASGLIQGLIETDLCSGQFFLHGGHVADFRPARAKPVLFMSEQSEFCPDKPIRGGIPICFPWFGAHPVDASLPAHGLARTSAWHVKSTALGDDGVVTVELGLSLEQLGLAQPAEGHWQLTYRIAWGTSLDLDLTIENVAEQTRECEVALHTYFSLADVHSSSVTGLEQQTYLDKLTGAVEGGSGRAIHFTQETDRVYDGAVPEVAILDPGNQREICLGPRNSRSTVVWNPWIAKSQRMPDFGDREYLTMCCVETANVASQRMLIPPHGSARVGCSITCR